MQILELEDAIIARLRELLPNVKVDELPLNPAEIGLAVGATTVWVAFSRVTFQAPEGVQRFPTKAPAQEANLQFEVFLRSQELRVEGHKKVYPIINTILYGLGGWIPPEQGRAFQVFYPTTAGFTNMSEGLWLYSMSFACKGVFNPNLRV